MKMNGTAPTIWTVTELTSYLKGYLEENEKLREVWLRGEISNFKHHTRGHMYFTLKDAESKIQAVMFQGNNRFLRFTPYDGQKVIARGSISIYERDGQYQLYVKEMQPDGIGNLYLAYEELKKKLEEKGYFKAERKKPLPPFPKRIALVTSPTGAAIRDMITTLRRRYPLVQIIVVPVLVQGEEAPLSIANGIDLVNRFGGIDLIITGRGGGSIEELWAFNEERVAEAIYHSTIHIISAVGHETDTTIADFVADLRAPTPTAAAELAVPHIEQLREKLNLLNRRGKRALLESILRKRKDLSALQKSSVLRRPLSLVEEQNQRLDKLLERLERNKERLIQDRKREFGYLKNRFLHLAGLFRIETGKNRVKELEGRLTKGIKRELEGKKKELLYQISRLEGLNPLSILKRGYTVAYSQDKKVIQSIKGVSPGEMLYLHFVDGVATTTVWSVEEKEENHGGKV
ncbi:MAG: exodeoxyribonuclease VII large subunit [Thermicanus sp.]|nr:exodeoxyribonuclease VII large subunit [Thermicanus sp.]